jgi:hypothetical protein
MGNVSRTSGTTDQDYKQTVRENGYIAFYYATSRKVARSISDEAIAFLSICLILAVGSVSDSNEYLDFSCGVKRDRCFKADLTDICELVV